MNACIWFAVILVSALSLVGVPAKILVVNFASIHLRAFVWVYLASMLLKYLVYKVSLVGILVRIFVTSHLQEHFRKFL